MSALTQFFLKNIAEVYFFYGLSFFSMGLAVFLELSHASELDFSKALRPLAGFGLVHGTHEWFEMFLLYHPDIIANQPWDWISPFRLAMLSASFLMLVAFGARLISGSDRSHLQTIMLLTIIAVWLLGLLWVIQTQPGERPQVIAADVYTRYSLAIPGAALTVWGLLLQRRRFIQASMSRFGHDVTFAALAFGMYGGVGQLFAAPSTIFPSTYLNADVFLQWFGFPIQVFRALMACFAAIFIIRSLRAFEEESRRQIENLREAQLAERQHLEAIRAELLHRTVKAQESERQRIAHDLHDETGQTLTALGLGLRSLSQSIPTHPERAAQQAKHLETLALAGIEELQRMVGGLHPPQLDDLGLMAALRWYAGQIKSHYNLPVNIASVGPHTDLSPEIRVVFFRVAQEAITNVIRHANATQASIMFESDSHTARLCIEDDGQGFDVNTILAQQDTNHPHWGLLGMMERADLIGAQLTITSHPGQGTRVELQTPLENNHE